MNSYIWGSLAWHFLHCITLTSPEKIKTDTYYTLFKNLGDILPCSVCQNHYKNHLKKLPLKDSCIGRNQLSLWLFNLHNIVNISLDKPAISVDKCVKLYIQKGKIKFNHKMGFKFLDQLAKSAKKTKDPISYINFFDTLDKTFPCSSCRKHYSELKEGLNNVKTGKQFYEWYIFIKSEWQHDHLYKGCQQLIQCQVENNKKSMVYNLKVNKEKHFLININTPSSVKKIVKLEYIPKNDEVVLYGHFLLYNGKHCKRKLLSDLNKDIKILNPKLTDIVKIDQKRRKAEVLQLKYNVSYLSQQFI